MKILKRFFLIFTIPLFILGCGGSGGGSGGAEEANNPAWIETQTSNDSRYIYIGRRWLDSEIYVPTKIPVDEEMSENNANYYEIRTNKTNLDITKYHYEWDNLAGEIRSFTSTGGQYSAEFSALLRSERTQLYATNSHFSAYDIDNLIQIDCDLTQTGRSICVAYGQTYEFENLDYPTVNGTENIDFAVRLESFLIEKLNLNQ